MAASCSRAGPKCRRVTPVGRGRLSRWASIMIRCALPTSGGHRVTRPGRMIAGILSIVGVAGVLAACGGSGGSGDSGATTLTLYNAQHEDLMKAMVDGF